jgi:peptidyl-prolyl cis-trans isomerase SurA
MKSFVYILTVFFFGISLLHGQFDDNILFDIGGDKVPVSEFQYIYTKNLGNKADFSRESLQEYLDLYINFKLKVKKAREMKLDTTAAFKREMSGYRQQLAKSYLVDKEVNEKLLLEAYERMQRDLLVAHIMINVKPEDDGIKERKLVDSLYNLLENRASFMQLAREYSDDVNTKNNGGILGWVTAMLPNGFYEFENHIYNLEKGKASKPFRTDFGYHIVRLVDERPARGEVEASHILIRQYHSGLPVHNASFRIDSIYERLVAGDNFGQLSRLHSMDIKTASRGGYLGRFGIGVYDIGFENQVFSLENDGDFSKPFATSLGLHIVKRISMPGIIPLEEIRRKLANDISQNERYDIARKALIGNIKNDAGFFENKGVLESFTELLDEDFYTFRWRAPEFRDAFLFELGSEKYMLSDLVSYMMKNQRSRLAFNKNTALSVAVNSIYNDFLEDECISFEEAKLEDKYPDFKYLMREYTEGNLLFEVMEKEVWNNAARDSAGLEAFFHSNRDRYMWQPRADIYSFNVKAANEKQAEKIYRYASKNQANKLIKKYNKKTQVISFTLDKSENGEKILEDMPFEAGYITPLVFDSKDNSASFRKIDRILPPEPKELHEARGYVIADYQEYLERSWIESMKKEYPITIHENVFNRLAK